MRQIARNLVAQTDWGRAALIGHTGFVGSCLDRQVFFTKKYNSSTIHQIAGQRFDTLVCAGAPGTMWVANADPKADKNNLQQLTSAIDAAVVKRVILISTIAVFDDVSASYTESTARFAEADGYGRNRRELELHIASNHDALVLRLPALFGPGLKKNFIFDVMNPIPSFLKPDRFAQLRAALTPNESTLLPHAFSYDPTLSMYKLNRSLLEETAELRDLEQAFERTGFLASSFTNSDSQYQYYNLANLQRDIETGLAHKLSYLNICSEPWHTGELYAALTGRVFCNNSPPLIREDVRTEHAGAFGRSGSSYLYDRDQVLLDLIRFVRGNA